MKIKNLVGQTIAIVALVTTLAGNVTAAVPDLIELAPSGFAAEPEGYPGDATPFEFAPGMLRGRRPASEAELRSWAAEHEITTVLSLDNYHDDADMAQRERVWALAAGLEFIQLPMHHLAGPSLEELQEAMRIIESHAEKRIYIHCKYGKDRTGLVVAAYRIKHEGASLQSAIDELYDFGHLILLSFWDRVLVHFQDDMTTS